MERSRFVITMHGTEFVKYIEEILEPFGPIKIRPMFGGYGIYKLDIIFAVIVHNELYFKADPNTAEYFKSEGSEVLTFDSKGKTISMQYYKVLDEVLENKALLEKWFNLAYKSSIDANLRAKRKKDKII